MNYHVNDVMSIKLPHELTRVTLSRIELPFCYKNPHPLDKIVKKNDTNTISLKTKFT
jgi:hypothetical protein